MSSDSSAAPVSVDHGLLPDWERADLPEPRPYTFGNMLRTVGPGAILLAGSIGGGEWIVGPKMAVEYGPSILWIATVAIFLQMLFNLEAVRYTMYTGEPILTGVMRLWPGPKFWGPVYGLLGAFQLATPAIAGACATVLVAAFLPKTGGVPASESTLAWVTAGIVLVTMVVLLSGKSIERVLERLSWGMIGLIFVFLIVVNVLFVPSTTWMETATGFVTPHAPPAGVDITFLALFAAMSGSGGLGNLAISNWFRDKGFGMGGRMGSIGGLLAHGHAELKPVGVIFPVTSANLDRWRHWWRYALADQSGLWAVGCLIGMFLNVNLASALVTPEIVRSQSFDMGTFQARQMAEQMWSGFWFLALLNGFWILYSTHLGNTDCLVRTLCDMGWAGSRRLQRGSASRLYAALLLGLTVWSLIALQVASLEKLFKVLGLVAGPITALAAVQILRINTRFLPREVRPPLWRRVGLVAVAIAYGGLAVAVIWSEVSG